MRTWRLPLLCLFMLASFACTGGQSGNEEGTPACARETTRTIGLDEATLEGTPLAGSPRSLFESVVSLVPETVSLRWYVPDGNGAYVDTSATLTVSGAPTSATLTADPTEGCRRIVTVEGAMLRFQSVDGAFDEVIPGRIYNGSDSARAADHHYQLKFYAGQESTTFANTYDGLIHSFALAGTYDLSAVMQHFEHPQVYFETSLFPAYGSLAVSADRRRDPHQEPVAVADWRAWVVPSGGASQLSEPSGVAGGGTDGPGYAGTGGVGGSGG